MAEKKDKKDDKKGGDGDALQAKLEDMKIQVNTLTGALQSKNVEVANISSELAEFKNNKLKMLLNIKELKEQISQQKNDTTDIYYFLNKKCDDSYDIISSLETQLLNEQTDREINEKLYEAKISELESALSHERKSASDKIMEMENKMNTLLNFQSMKEAYETQIASLQQQLDAEKTNTKAEIHFLEQKLYKEKVRLHEEMEQRLAGVEEDINSKVRDQLSSDTVDIHTTNEKMSRELHFQNKNTMSIIKRDEGILESERKLRLELDIAKNLENELLSKLNMYTKINQKLNDNLLDMKATSESQARFEVESREQSESTIAALKEEVARLTGVVEANSSKRNELISFLIVSFEIVKKKKEGKHRGAEQPLSSPGRNSNNSSSSSNNNNGIPEHELNAFGEGALISLVKGLLLRFPHKFKSIFLQYYRSIISSITNSTAALKVDDMDSPRGPDYVPSLITQIGLQNNTASSSTLPAINTSSPARHAPRDYSLFLDSPPPAEKSSSAPLLSPKAGKLSKGSQTEARVVQEGGLLWMDGDDAQSVNTSLTSGGVATFPNRRHAASGDSVSGRSHYSTSDVLSPTQKYLIDGRKKVLREKKELKKGDLSPSPNGLSDVSSGHGALPTYVAPQTLRPSYLSHPRRAEPPKRGRVTAASLSGAQMVLSGNSAPLVSLKEYEEGRRELSKIARDFESTRFAEAFSLADGPSAPPMSDGEDGEEGGEGEEGRNGVQPLLALSSLSLARQRLESGGSELTNNTRLTDSISPRSDITQSPRLR